MFLSVPVGQLYFTAMSGELRPRLCVLEKGNDGYGFHLHGEKNKAGQFIRLVELGSPAELSGVKAGDKLVFVNGESVDGESHQQVVSKIRAVTGKLELIVVDQETAEYLKKHNLTCRKEFVTEGLPTFGDQADTAAQERNGTATESSPVPVSVPNLEQDAEPVPVQAPARATNGDMGLDTLSLSSKVNLYHISINISILSCIYPAASQGLHLLDFCHPDVPPHIPDPRQVYYHNCA